MAKNTPADLDTTAANNTDVAGVSMAEGMLPSLVNNGIRAFMAMIKKWWNDLGGQVTVGGTGNAITITSSNPNTYQSLVSGIRILFKPSADNSGATTINLDSLGVKAVRKISGGSDVALAGGEILNGQRAEVVYDSTANSSAGAWILINGASTTSYQPLDSDLTAIAGLTATTDNFLQSKASAWASRTPAQVTADLIAVVGDSGSGGTKGLVPAPSSGDAAAGKFLSADGTWAVPTAATASYNAVGSYALLYDSSGGNTAAGSTLAGSNLQPANAGATYSGGVRSGTWRAMGYSNGSSGSGSPRVTLWIRTA